MLNINYANIRDLQRNYRKVAKEVNKTNKPTIVMSKNEPQFAIVSLKTLDKLQQVPAKNSAQKLLELAEWAEKQNFDLPKDLSEKHNEYAWD